MRRARLFVENDVNEGRKLGGDKLLKLVGDVKDGLDAWEDGGVGRTLKKNLRDFFDAYDSKGIKDEAKARKAAQEILADIHDVVRAFGRFDELGIDIKNEL